MKRCALFRQTSRFSYQQSVHPHRNHESPPASHHQHPARESCQTSRIKHLFTFHFLLPFVYSTLHFLTAHAADTMHSHTCPALQKIRMAARLRRRQKQDVQQPRQELLPGPSTVFRDQLVPWLYPHHLWPLGAPAWAKQLYFRASAHAKKAKQTAKAEAYLLTTTYPLYLPQAMIPLHMPIQYSIYFSVVVVVFNANTKTLRFCFCSIPAPQNTFCCYITFLSRAETQIKRMFRFLKTCL